MAPRLVGKIHGLIAGGKPDTSRMSFEEKLRRFPTLAFQESIDGGYDGNDLETLIDLSKRHQRFGRFGDYVTYGSRAAGHTKGRIQDTLPLLEVALDTNGYQILSGAVAARIGSASAVQEVLNWVMEEADKKYTRQKSFFNMSLAMGAYAASARDAEFTLLAAKAANAYWFEFNVLGKMMGQSDEGTLNADRQFFFRKYVEMTQDKSVLPDDLRRLADRGWRVIYQAEETQHEASATAAEETDYTTQAGWKKVLTSIEKREIAKALNVLGLKDVKKFYQLGWDQVIAAYRKRAFETHPDYNPSEGPEAKAFKGVKQARDLLEMYRLPNN